MRRQLASLGQLTEQGGNMALTLASDILFDFASAALRPAARENLAKLATLRVLLFPRADVKFEGHTDRVGEDAYNQWLSEQRALAVYRYFLEQSAAAAGGASRLTAVEKLMAMPYAAEAQASAARDELMGELGGAVIGKGEREPVEDVPGPSERNRRVVLIFPPAQTGEISSLCEAPAAARRAVAV